LPAAAHPSPRPLDRLAALQKADGSWALTAELAAFIGTPLEALDREASSRGFATGEAQSLFATALALAWLEERAAGDRDEWALLARKAHDWLLRSGPSEALTHAAREFVRSLRV
jgi:hypothetical protein